MKIDYDSLTRSLAETMADSMDIDSLVDFFIQNQINYLESLSENELLELAKQYEVYHGN